VRVLSDLHLEFGSFEYRYAGEDLVVLAGDTHTKLNGVKWAMEVIPEHVPVLYLLGNHEYYGAKLPRLVEKLKELAYGSHVQVLQDDVFEFGGYRFFGATLWTDMALHGDPFVGSVEATRMNDYKRVRCSHTYRRLKPANTKAEHAATRAKIEAFLQEGDASKLVVLTHHAPSARSLPERRRDKLISCAYASHMDEIIEQYEPLMWVHGHIHHSQNYRIGKTHMIANPRAYVDEPNESFDPDFLVDLSHLER